MITLEQLKALKELEDAKKYNKKRDNILSIIGVVRSIKQDVERLIEKLNSIDEEYVKNKQKENNHGKSNQEN